MYITKYAKWTRIIRLWSLATPLQALFVILQLLHLTEKLEICPKRNPPFKFVHSESREMLLRHKK